MSPIWRTPRRVARLPEGAPEPTPEERQAAQRDRRRQHLSVHLIGEFDLAVEVAQIVDPLAEKAARYPTVLVVELVAELSTAVHSAVVAIAKMLNERSALARCSHIDDYEKRQEAVRLLLELAEKPPVPSTPDTASVKSRAWASELVDTAARYAGQLSSMLDHARPSDHLRGAPTVSERVIAALRDVDASALTLSNALDRAEQARKAARSAQDTRDDEIARARATLAALGVDVGDRDPVGAGQQ